MSLAARATLAALSLSSLAVLLLAGGCSAGPEPRAGERVAADDDALLSRCPPGTVRDCGYYDLGPTGKPILSCTCDPLPAPPAPQDVKVGADDGGCILFDDGSVQCWAGNTYAMTDAGNTLVYPTYKLSNVPLPAAAIHVAAGASSPTGTGCAVLTDHTVWCWGSNAQGQLGNGTTQPSATPVQVLTAGDGGLTPLLATQVASKNLFSCAITTQGGVACWGDDTSANLGDPSIAYGPQTYSAIAVPVGPLPYAATSLALGFTHACALTSDGGVYCWGDNGGFQGAYWGTTLQNGPSLGVGATTALVPTPARVVCLPAATAISAGYETSCADTAQGLYCWGLIGAASAPASQNPTYIGAASPGLTSSIFSTCELVNGTPECWGRLPTSHAYDTALTPLFSTATSATTVSLGAASACVITSGTGHVVCANADSANPITVY